MRIDLHQVGGAGAEAALARVDQHRQAEGLALLQVAGAPAPDGTAVQLHEVRGRPEAGLVRVAREQDERAARRDAPKLLGGLLRQRGRVHHHHVDAAEQRAQPVAEILLLLRRGPRLAAIPEALAGAALERVRVARHPQPPHTHHQGPVGAVGASGGRPR